MEDILSHIKTKDQVLLLDAQIDELVESLYEVKKNRINEILNKTAGAGTSLLLKKALAKTKDRDQARDFLQKLKNKLQSLKTFKLTISFEPTDEIIDKLYEWIKTNIKDNVILEIYHDKTILGGAIIDYEGFYKDYTLKKMLDETFEKKRDVISKLIYE